MSKSSKFQQVTVSILTVAVIILLVFYGYRPVSYNLSVGSVSNRDIYAQRSFTDTYQTEYEAVMAKNMVSPIFIRSEEISEQNVENVELFFSILGETRNKKLDEFGMPAEDWDESVESMMTTLEDEFTTLPDEDVINTFLSMSTSAFGLIRDKAVSISEIIMMDNVNSDSLSGLIEEQVNQFTENYSEYSQYADELSSTLESLLTANSVFNSDATNEAAENAYITALNEPITVDKGTKIISAGDVVTEHMYQNLVDLELVRSDSFDLIILGRIAVYIAILAVALTIYFTRKESDRFPDMRIFYMMVITFIIPILASVYLSDFSALMIVTLYFTTIASTYLGTRDGIILSIIEMFMMWPLNSFDAEFILITTIGIIFCATIAGKKNRAYNSASLIFTPSFMCVLAVVSYNAIFSSSLASIIESGVWTGISAALSIILAVGTMPIVELFSKAVSPVRLIELSQPSHPLLRRLFLEAPGTYSHSMMVASLADAAADAIGADALFCRVASYYHDIGKLENPVYFTENQSEGINPHDNLTTEESVRIITAHVTDGVKLAHKYHLPDTFSRVIEEHHGTTYPGLFLCKRPARRLKTRELILPMQISSDTRAGFLQVKSPLLL